MIYLNNSSLTDLACGRRYVYRVVRGAVTPGKSVFDIGTFFHHLMWIIEPQDNVATLVGPMRNVYAKSPNASRIQDNIWALVKDDLTKIALAQLACKVRDELDLANTAEQWRELTLEDRDINDPSDVCFIGTPDLITYDANTGHVVLTDYKTTGSPITDEKLNNYRVSSQLFFYALLCKENSDKFSTHVADALINNRIKFRYVIANYKQQALHIEPPRDVSTSALNELAEYINEKSQLAAFYHQYPQSARKDGATFNHCMFCPFVNVCAINNPQQEERLINNWPLGFKPYDPRTREH